MKKAISSILFLAVLLSFASILLSSCAEVKQTPVYRGMSLGSYHSIKSALTANGGKRNTVQLCANITRNSDGVDRYGQYTGDYVGRDEDIDAKDPFFDSGASDGLEDALLDEFSSYPPGVPAPPNTPNDDDYFRFFTIAVHIDNPDDFEILSFTINGEKYTRDMFEKGSTGQTIYFTPPHKTFKFGTHTVVSFSITISDIKFLDGDEIKDVIIDGDTELKMNDASARISANFYDVNVGASSLSFVVNTDNTLSIKQSESASLSDRDLKAVLYDGDRIVASRVLPLKGETTVHFDGLVANTLYQLLVVGYYKDYEEDEKTFHVLCDSVFYTDSALLFKNVEIGEESVSFGYHWNEEHQNKEITALKLYMGEDYIKDIDTDVTQVNGLLTGTGYRLVAEYLDGDTTASIYLEFTTLAKSITESDRVS